MAPKETDPKSKDEKVSHNFKENTRKQLDFITFSGDCEN